MHCPMPMIPSSSAQLKRDLDIHSSDLSRKVLEDIRHGHTLHVPAAVVTYWADHTGSGRATITRHQQALQCGKEAAVEDIQ